jgi:hypothetical protein
MDSVFCSKNVKKKAQQPRREIYITLPNFDLLPKNLKSDDGPRFYKQKLSFFLFANAYELQSNVLNLVSGTIHISYLSSIKFISEIYHACVYRARVSFCTFIKKILQ